MALTSQKLNQEQRDQLRVWLAAEYETRLILAWFVERGWPTISPQAIHEYRKRDAIDIEKIRAERRSAALTTGIAIKEERIERLKLHADRLEELKWQADEKGRYWNEKAWRETVQQIADELEPKKVEMSGAVESTVRVVAVDYRAAAREVGTEEES